MAERRERRRGDRKDGWLVRDIDSMHAIFPFAMPSRTANEAVMNEQIDLTAITRYLEEKNKGETEFPHTFFHVICAAIAKTFYLRPKLNRFYAGGRLYERNRITLTFVIKKKFSDDAPEGLAIIDVDDSAPPAEQIHEKVKQIVYSVRKEDKKDGTTDLMDNLVKMPGLLLRIVFGILRWLESHGWYPDSMMKDDPYYASVFLSNLGSIKMHASYHHLSDWGTNSFFVIVGEKKPTPYFAPDGAYEMRDALDLGITVDERIADGMYYANSIRLLRELLQNPSLLDLPIASPVTVGDTTYGKEN